MRPWRIASVVSARSSALRASAALPSFLSRLPCRCWVRGLVHSYGVGIEGGLVHLCDMGGGLRVGWFIRMAWGGGLRLGHFLSSALPSMVERSRDPGAGGWLDGWLIQAVRQTRTHHHVHGPARAVAEDAGAHHAAKVGLWLRSWCVRVSQNELKMGWVDG